MNRNTVTAIRLQSLTRCKVAQLRAEDLIARSAPAVRMGCGASSVAVYRPGVEARPGAGCSGKEAHLVWKSLAQTAVLAGWSKSATLTETVENLVGGVWTVQDGAAIFEEEETPRKETRVEEIGVPRPGLGCVDGMFLLISGTMRATKRYPRKREKRKGSVPASKPTTPDLVSSLLKEVISTAEPEPEPEPEVEPAEIEPTVVWEYTAGADAEEEDPWIGVSVLLGASRRNVTVRAVGEAKLILVGRLAWERLQTSSVLTKLVKHELKCLQSEYRVLISNSRKDLAAVLGNGIYQLCTEHQLPWPELEKVAGLKKKNGETYTAFAATAAKAVVLTTVRFAQANWISRSGSGSSHKEEVREIARRIADAEEKKQEAARTLEGKTVLHVDSFINMNDTWKDQKRESFRNSGQVRLPASKPPHPPLAPSALSQLCAGRRSRVCSHHINMSMSPVFPAGHEARHRLCSAAGRLHQGGRPGRRAADVVNCGTNEVTGR